MTSICGKLSSSINVSMQQAIFAFGARTFFLLDYERLLVVYTILVGIANNGGMSISRFCSCVLNRACAL